MSEGASFLTPGIEIGCETEVECKRKKNARIIMMGTIAFLIIGTLLMLSNNYYFSVIFFIIGIYYGTDDGIELGNKNIKNSYEKWQKTERGKQAVCGLIEVCIIIMVLHQNHLV